MISMNRCCCRIHSRILRVYNRGGPATWANDKGFDAEASDEIGNTFTVCIRREITLIPGEAEWRIRKLGYESIKFRVRRQATCLQVHDFHIAQ